jgi:hypothetical protein
MKASPPYATSDPATSVSSNDLTVETYAAIGLARQQGPTVHGRYVTIL